MNDVPDSHHNFTAFGWQVAPVAVTIRAMRRTLFVTTAVLLSSLAVPSTSSAWGAAAHRFIMRRAIEALPAELRPFFLQNADEVVMRANDPDLWRTAGWDDDSNHFVDFGVPEYGPYPFAGLPRSQDAAVEKFGAATVKKYGTLPWREAEEFGNLRRAFEGFARNYQYAPHDTVLFAAVAAHYIQDAHQPFHATNNYDGQLTNQLGIHARFESALLERFQQRLVVSPVPSLPVGNARDRAFDVLTSSYTLVEAVLAADKTAADGKDTYDDDYFEKFFAGVKTILERQLSASISDTVALIVGAWEAAGKPALHPIARSVQKRR